VSSRLAVAIIPAREGSKGVPGKNLVEVGGRSLVARAVEACRRAGNIGLVVVSTDGDAIAAEAERHGARVVRRPAALASDEATSESALLHALAELDSSDVHPDVVAFVQCTSPFVDSKALADAVDRVSAGEIDVAFAAAPTYEFLWSVEPDDRLGLAKGINHDAAVRLRRQDRQPDWRETGAFYVMDTDGFRAAGHRFFGRVAVAPVPERTSIEIDTTEHIEVARALSRERRDEGAELSGVVALVTDFDGVHTDDRATVGEDGAEFVVVSRADGHGIKLLREAGVPVLILSTETNSVVARRAAKLGVDCIHGVDDKVGELRRWLAEHDLDPAHTAYIGNDVQDLATMEFVGCPIAVCDGHPSVIERAAYVTRRPGGRGAVREVAELILAGKV
jgi:YrbI family 3-deoxy-D-manno-octulosonate 8-phosphate phosphatase